MVHPGRAPDPISRREMLRRAAAAGIALPSLAALLEACGGDEGGTTATTPGGSELKLARPDDPVTLPLTDDNPAIVEEGSRHFHRAVWREDRVHGFPDRR